MRWLILLGRTLILAAAFIPALVSGTEDASAALSGRKAVFVYNFLQFTTWPPGSNGSGMAELILCAYAHGALRDALTDLEGITVGQRRIHVKVWPSTPSDCRILYLAASAESRAAGILHAVRETAVLTIAENHQAPVEGIAIGLFEEGGKLAFAVNLEAARKNGLKFSSKLLRLAKNVYSRPESEP